MKVNVNITKNCKLVAQGIDEKKEAYAEYIKYQNLIFSIRDNLNVFIRAFIEFSVLYGYLS